MGGPKGNGVLKKVIAGSLVVVCCALVAKCVGEAPPRAVADTIIAPARARIRNGKRAAISWVSDSDSMAEAATERRERMWLQTIEMAWAIGRRPNTVAIYCPFDSTAALNAGRQSADISIRLDSISFNDGTRTTRAAYTCGYAEPGYIWFVIPWDTESAEIRIVSNDDSNMGTPLAHAVAHFAAPQGTRTARCDFFTVDFQYHPVAIEVIGQGDSSAEELRLEGCDENNGRATVDEQLRGWAFVGDKPCAVRVVRRAAGWIGRGPDVVLSRDTDHATVEAPEVEAMTPYSDADIATLREKIARKRHACEIITLKANDIPACVENRTGPLEWELALAESPGPPPQRAEEDTAAESTVSGPNDSGWSGEL